MTEPITANPTWEHPIRQFFNDVDINHMLRITNGKLDLGSYEHVSSRVEDIWKRVSDKGDMIMPIPPSEPWTDEMIATFLTWKNNGCPQR